MRAIALMLSLVLAPTAAFAIECQFVAAKKGVSFASLIKDGYEMKLWIARGAINNKASYVLLQKGASVFACNPEGTISFTGLSIYSSATCGELIEPKDCDPIEAFLP